MAKKETGLSKSLSNFRKIYNSRKFQKNFSIIRTHFGAKTYKNSFGTNRTIKRIWKEKKRRSYGMLSSGAVNKIRKIKVIIR